MQHLRALVATGLMTTCLATAQHRNRTENTALLGVVTVEQKAGVTIAHILEDSPAAKAQLEAGDVVTKIGKTKIQRATDVDDALRSAKPGASVEIAIKRGKKKRKLKAEVMARSAYEGSFLKRPSQSVGFAAPEWFGFAWANTSKNRPAPTQENTRDKVVVFHTFQSW